MTRRIRLTIEYDGTDFHGWQSQRDEAADGPAGSRTVQGRLELALRKLTRQPIRVVGASRTDSGVHALGQVAHFDRPAGFDLPDERIAAALNANLPDDVAVVAAGTAPPDFHAQHSATGKIYRYALFSRRTRSATRTRTHWQVPHPLRLERMREAGRRLVGKHDLSAFATELNAVQEKRQSEGKPRLETVRELRRVDVTSPPDPGSEGHGSEIFIEVEGAGFLYKMVRTIVGSLVEVGRGARDPEWISAVLASRDRSEAGPTAPAKGLCLVRVLYDAW
jgi:tRNA pseudouridine38-40 synthase